MIDIWLEDLAKNYVLNTPSLFYDYVNRSLDSIVDRHPEEEGEKVK